MGDALELPHWNKNNWHWAGLTLAIGCNRTMIERLELKMEEFLNGDTAPALWCFSHSTCYDRLIQTISLHESRHKLWFCQLTRIFRSLSVWPADLVLLVASYGPPADFCITMDASDSPKAARILIALSLESQKLAPAHGSGDVFRFFHRW